MTVLEGTTKFGAGEPTTAEAPAVDCPQCAEIVFTETIAAVTCDSCSYEFHATDHRGEPCPAVECADCGKTISFIQEQRLEVGGQETYYCHHCHTILAVETADGPEPVEMLLNTDWLMNGRSVDDVGTGFGGEYRATEVRTERQQVATALLNIEAKENDSSFHAYHPGDTDAYLCLSDESCIGYITWNWDKENPELGQLYILPAYQEQGIGSGFVEAWREDVVGSDGRFNVNNPNAITYRLLRSIGAIELTDDGLDFPGCTITGHSIDLPEEWVESSHTGD